VSDDRIAIRAIRSEANEECVTRMMLSHWIYFLLQMLAIVWLPMAIMGIIYVSVDEPLEVSEVNVIVGCLVGSLVVQCTLLYRIERLFDHKIPLLPL
jgi:hypothetical protein